MRILIVEDNLMWSVRLEKALRAHGHETRVLANSSSPIGEADLAILNLANPLLASRDFVMRLQALGVRTLGHAGHKEKSLLQAGRDLGLDAVVTNGMLAKRLERVIGLAKTLDSGSAVGIKPDS